MGSSGCCEPRRAQAVLRPLSSNIRTLLQKANLPVRVVEKPSQVNGRLRDHGDRGAFLMDIGRDKGEVFVVRPGRAEVQVLNVDRGHRQVVLYVREEAARFTFERYDRQKRKYVTVTEDVPESRRHFLLGMDEKHLFVAPLPKAVSTVRDAHRVLAPPGIRQKKAKKEKVLRQGEWFFTQVEDAKTLGEIERVARKQGILKKTTIGAQLGPMRGRPHIVDERVLVVKRRPADIRLLERRLKALPEGASGLRVRMSDGSTRQVRKLSDIPGHDFDSREYVRGVVRHPDHRPRRLAGWHLVTSNTEHRQQGPVIEGMTWVD